jgi:hypothetical protein
MRKGGNIPAAALTASRMDAIVRFIRDRLADAQIRSATRTDNSHSDLQFKVGDSCWLDINMAKNLPLRQQRGTATKLEPRWVGPYTVQAVVSARTYRLDLPPHLKINKVIDISRLRPAIVPIPQAWPGRTASVPPPPTVIDNEQEWDVERILDERTYGRKKYIQFLVQWKGYPASESSWEFADDLPHARALINAYRRARTRPRSRVNRGTSS